jgi:neutral ceramidase
MAMPTFTYKAGASSRCITPDELVWLAGYAARTAPARGRISDLYASALAIEDEAGQRFVMASLDIIAITPIIAEPVAAAALARHGLARSQLLLAPTHTHYGPEFRPDKAVFFNIPSEYAAKLPAIAERFARALAETIGEALARLEPVRLFARTTTASFAHNRRRVGAASRAAQRPPRLGGPTAEDVVDHDVPVLECVDAAGNRKAIVFGYACHNTTIPPDDLRYCGDWAGFAKERLQQAYPGATAVFLPGAGADQDPEPSGSIELSRRYGQELANAVEKSLDAPGIEITGPIHAEWEDVLLALEPVTNEKIEQMLASSDSPQRVKAKFLLEKLDRGESLITSYAAPLQVVRFGNELLLIALSGEPVVDWALNLKREVKGPCPRVVWVAGYCNDMFGYVPTRRVKAEGGYEAGRASLWSSIPAPFTDDLEDRITAAVHRLVTRVGSAGDHWHNV